MKTVLVRFLNDNAGGTAVEYGLIAAVIGLVIVSTMRAVGTSVSSQLHNAAGNLR